MSDGGPAFPFEGPRNRNDGNGGVVGNSPGMSLRDWFAGQALVGVLSSEKFHEAIEAITNDGVRGVGIVAGAAYGIADAMLKAREL